MDLYVRLWPVWVLVAIMMVNILRALLKYMQENAAPSANWPDVIAAITAGLLVIASVVNVLLCVLNSALATCG